MNEEKILQLARDLYDAKQVVEMQGMRNTANLSNEEKREQSAQYELAQTKVWRLKAALAKEADGPDNCFWTEEKTGSDILLDQETYGASYDEAINKLQREFKFGLSSIADEMASSFKAAYNESMTPTKQRHMTPNDIEILLHYHVSPAKHPRLGAPAVKKSIDRFINDGILDAYYSNNISYTTTRKGRLLVDALCKTSVEQPKTTKHCITCKRHGDTEEGGTWGKCDELSKGTRVFTGLCSPGGYVATTNDFGCILWEAK